jgi:hypothetical protein
MWRWEGVHRARDGLLVERQEWVLAQAGPGHNQGRSPSARGKAAAAHVQRLKRKGGGERLCKTAGKNNEQITNLLIIAIYNAMLCTTMQSHAKQLKSKCQTESIAPFISFPFSAHAHARRQIF